MHDSALPDDGASGEEGGAVENPVEQGSETAVDEQSGHEDDSSSEAGTSGDDQPTTKSDGWLTSLTLWVEAHAGAILAVYLIAYAVFGVLTVRFFPFYSAHYGDEASYYSFAQHPWTLIGDFFEGYRPKEVMNPYNFRFFLTPFAVLFKLFGFTYVGARLIVFSYGLLMLLLMYWIAGSLVRPLWSLAAVLLLSVSPSFVYLTHVVRPEGMMSLFVLICVWLIIRHTADVPRKTYFLVGLTSASALMVHYNGVLLSPMFFIMLLCYDLRDWTWRKITAFIVGGALFAAVFLVVNFLPAHATIKEFGIMPVTFASSSGMPILKRDWSTLFMKPFFYYLSYYTGNCYFEIRTCLFTSLLCLPMFFGLFYRSGRREWLCGIAIGLYILLQVLIIPNLRYSYAFYVIPLAYLLASVGLSKLPSSWDMKLVAAAAIVGIVAVYGYDNSISLRRANRIYESNEGVRKVLRELVESHGPPETVTVMAGQEQHCFLHDTRFRTFHSVIATRDFGKTLDLISPDIVMFRPWDVTRFELYLVKDTVRRARAGKATPQELHDLVAKGLFAVGPDGRMYRVKEGMRELLRRTLVNRGYVRYDDGRLMSHGSPLLIFVRADAVVVPSQSSTSRSSG